MGVVCWLCVLVVLQPSTDSDYKKRMLELYDQRLAELETVKQQYEEQMEYEKTKGDKKKKPAPKVKK